MRRRIVKPRPGSGFESITHVEIDEVSPKRRALESLQEADRQLRSLRKQEREREAPLKALWHKDRDKARAQGQKLPMWKQWIEAHN